MSQEDIENQLKQWTDDVTKEEIINEFLDSDFYNHILKDGFFKDYVVDAVERYVATGDQKYIIRATAPFYTKAYIQSLIDSGRNADNELKNYYKSSEDNT